VSVSNAILSGSIQLWMLLPRVKIQGVPECLQGELAVLQALLLLG